MITAIVLTKNEEKNIPDCIERLGFCKEIIVIDDNSKDKTVEIARNAGAIVFGESLDDDFSKQRNFGLEKAKGDWVLFVDADERIGKDLSEEIIRSINSVSRNYDGYYLKRRDFMWGRELKFGETGNIGFIRLGKKNNGKWEGRIHEKWILNGAVGNLKNPILHYPHQNIKEFLEDINFYTDLRAQELYGKGINVGWFSIIYYPVGKFLLNYFIKMGFMDGVEGLMFAIMMSLHSFLVRGKLWLLRR